jgi:DNA-binding XRE family transcriptional regulator
MSCVLDTNKSASFADWLNNELQTRRMSQAELARLGGISRSSINRVAVPGNKPGWDVCYGIAKGFKLSPASVFIKADLITDVTSYDEERAENASYRFSLLSEIDQLEILELMEIKLRRAELLRETNSVEAILKTIPPNAIDEVFALLDEYLKKHGYRRIK